MMSTFPFALGAFGLQSLFTITPPPTMVIEGLPFAWKASHAVGFKATMA